MAIRIVFVDHSRMQLPDRLRNDLQQPPLKRTLP